MLRFLWLTVLWALPAARGGEFEASVRLEAETHGFRLYEVRFPSQVKSRFAANDLVWGHLFVPRRARKPPPCVLLLPIMAAPNAWIESRFVHELVRSGYAAMWLEMPYQFHRRPAPLVPSGSVFLARTAKRLGGNFRQSVADARRALSWLEGSGLVDGSRLGLFGVSLGALVGSSAYAQDARPRGAVFLLGGADFPDLVRRGSMTSGFVRAAGITAEELREAWRGLDPLERREANRGKRVLLINARSDTVIPAENARRLRDAFPDSVQRWVPLGHYGAVLHLSWTPSYVARAFAVYLD